MSSELEAAAAALRRCGDDTVSRLLRENASRQEQQERERDGCG